MTAELNHVRPGDPLRIKAGTFNTMIDAARAYRDRESSQRVPRTSTDTLTGVLTARNVSGQPIPRFGIMAINAIAIDPTDNEPQFAQQPVVDVVAPTEATKFVIATAPIPPGRVGRVLLVGVTPAQIDVTDEDHEYATAEADTMAHLVSASTGPARIVWQQSGTGTVWAIVQMPVGTADEPKGLSLIKYDGSFSSGRYTGHLVNDDGSPGDGVQFRFVNDPGWTALVSTDEHVLAVPIQSWDEDNTVWSADDGEKYWATLSPWSAWR